MQLKNTFNSYGSISKFIHWLIFILIVVMLIIGFTMNDISNEVLKEQAYTIHKSIGLVILAIMLFRFIWMQFNPRPELKQFLKPWEYIAERAVIYLIYLALFIIPISGWITTTADGYIASFFGLFSVPFPGVPKSELIAHNAGRIHEIGVWCLIALLSLHSLAALKHYFINKDHILQRMWPGSGL